MGTFKMKQKVKVIFFVEQEIRDDPEKARYVITSPCNEFIEGVLSDIEESHGLKCENITIKTCI